MNENYTESEMASDLIDYWDGEEGYHLYPEVHYNNYGKRGVVDLVQQHRKRNGRADGIAYELKSNSAIEQATGANEIIRQFNKMVENFNDGSDHLVSQFKLLFAGSEKALQHILKNKSLYQSVSSSHNNIGLMFPNSEESGDAVSYPLFESDISFPRSLIIMYNSIPEDSQKNFAEIIKKSDTVDIPFK